jgi:transposase
MASPQVLSVDDFALRKRHPSGTLLPALAPRRPLAVPPAREASTVAQWLQAHPGGEVLGRDRAEAEAEAARLGAPGACQGADRGQLLQQLADVLTQVFTATSAQLAPLPAERRAAPTPGHDPACRAAASARPSLPLAPLPSPTAAARLARQRRPRRWAHDRQGWSDHQQGWALDAMAHQVGLSRRTVPRDSPRPEVSRTPAPA